MNYLSLIYEFLGTFLLVLSIFTSGSALIIGLTLALIIWLSGSVSGGHVNPAVSIAFYLKDALTREELIGYILAQVAGGLSAVKVFQLLV
jgi:aquaporin Z